MNRYLAKSNPEETIQEHTDNLLKNFEILKEFYPKIKINWDILRQACIYHDLGKMNRKFQDKIEKREKHNDEIAHNLLSIAFIEPKLLKETFSFSNEEMEVMVQAVARHHERGDYNAENYDEEVELLKSEAENFKYDKIEIGKIKRIGIKYFSNNRTYSDSEQFLEYVKIKGLLNRLDYAASGNIEVETKNDFLLKGLDALNYDWNDLQKFMRDNSERNVVVVAQTGMGKTEAGLLWLGNNKGFFTLPLKTAINEIYKRITTGISGDENREKVGLLHSDTYSKYLENSLDEDNIEEKYNKTRQLSLPLTICTLDQIFDFVFRYRDFEPKLATLAYSKVIIDEVQMYSSDLLAYLILGLSYINKVGGKFAILTATLPEIVTDLLKNEKIDFIQGEKPYINNMIRHSIKIVDSQIDSKIIASGYNNNKILVICNTVKKAQEIYSELLNNEELKIDKSNIKMLHSKFIKMDRKKKESQLMEIGKKGSIKSEIWVATQVVEASLDIDFDILFTELSDINGLFQRFGRCYRNRAFEQDGYNCYVFNGGTEDCSGVKYVVDKDIFRFSKDILRGLDGKIDEKQKLEIIGKIYTTEKLKNTDYFKKVIDNMDYIKNINEYEMTKSEVKDRFRNINNITVIPKPVYDTNKTEIDLLVKEVNSKSDNKKERVKKIDLLKGFTVDIRENEGRNCDIISIIKIGKYEEIPIIECGYSYEEGIVIEKKKNETVDNFDARYF